jgi:hypothetical protein
MRHPVSATQGMTEARSTVSARRHGRLWIWAGFVVLFAIHHDFWWWGDRSLVLGFMPIGLAYHAAFSIAAGVLWALACRHAWPEHLEAWAEKSSRVGEWDEVASTGKGGNA